MARCKSGGRTLQIVVNTVALDTDMGGWSTGDAAGGWGIAYQHARASIVGDYVARFVTDIRPAGRAADHRSGRTRIRGHTVGRIPQRAPRCADSNVVALDHVGLTNGIQLNTVHIVTANDVAQSRGCSTDNIAAGVVGCA